ncbi:hypothetical protein [Yinghuangia soli]|uniref:Uncharacterized protein n=1 Tax=Yinghuangia soli TaxID=2908204 RepID=A0AA41Q8Z8_9ACTN|nr:hypothetical protein [Yinghuangia soli]MCF2532539.1 hypothetical protein [Yinghuangia soli]
MPPDPDSVSRPEVPPDPGRRARRRRRGAAAAAIAGATALIAAHGAYYRYWIVDDAAVTFAYARTIGEGHGISLQAGAPSVEGYSNTTWLVLLLIGRALGLFDQGAVAGFPDYVLFPKLLAVVCCLGTVAAMYRAAACMVSRPAVVTFAAGAVLAAVPSYVIWCFSGLENSLYAMLVAWLAAVMVRARADRTLEQRTPAIACGLLACAAALTRPDGAIYAAAFPLLVLLAPGFSAARVRSAAVSALAFAVPFGAFLLWRYANWGLWLPNTAVAKDQGLPSPADLAKVGELVGYVGWPAVLVGVGLIGVALGRPSRLRGLLPGLLIPLALALAGYAVLQADWMLQWRFATPVWPLAALAVAVCAADALGRGDLPRRAAVVAVLTATAIFSGTLCAQAAERFHDNPTFPVCWVADRYGRSFNGLADIAGLDDKATFLIPDMGGTALTSRLRLVDFAGLADAEIARYYHEGDLSGLRDHVFETVRPTFIRTGGAWWGNGTGLANDPRLERDYEVLQRDRYDVDGRTYLRKGVVASPEVMERLRVAAAQDAHRAMRDAGADPLRACGPDMRAGQTDAKG